MVIETCWTLLKVALLTVIDGIKALLPTRILPRKSVTGQVVLITGSGSGIGRLMAIEFVKLGARLVLWDINEKENQKTLQLLEQLDGEAHAYTINLAKREVIYAVAEKVKQEVGNVDILINNAGIVIGKKFFECPDELMELTMTTTKAFLPYMMERNRGHIVTVASMAGVLGAAGIVDYCASKHGVIGFTKSLASELILMKKNGIHLTTVCPYFINTGMFGGVTTTFPVLFPILDPEYVVEQIMEAVLTNKEVIYMPKSCYFAAILASCLPSRAAHVLEQYLGCMSSMEHFVGRTNH